MNATRIVPKRACRPIGSRRNDGLRCLYASYAEERDQRQALREFDSIGHAWKDVEAGYAKVAAQGGVRHQVGSRRPESN